jgi:hypothetical protein
MIIITCPCSSHPPSLPAPHAPIKEAALPSDEAGLSCLDLAEPPLHVIDPDVKAPPRLVEVVQLPTLQHQVLHRLPVVERELELHLHKQGQPRLVSPVIWSAGTLSSFSISPSLTVKAGLHPPLAGRIS